MRPRQQRGQVRGPGAHVAEIFHVRPAYSIFLVLLLPRRYFFSHFQMGYGPGQVQCSINTPMAPLGPATWSSGILVTKTKTKIKYKLKCTRQTYIKTNTKPFSKTKISLTWRHSVVFYLPPAAENTGGIFTTLGQAVTLSFDFPIPKFNQFVFVARSLTGKSLLKIPARCNE